MPSNYTLSAIRSISKYASQIFISLSMLILVNGSFCIATNCGIPRSHAHTEKHKNYVQ